MKNTKIITLLASLFVLGACGVNETPKSSTVELTSSKESSVSSAASSSSSSSSSSTHKHSYGEWTVTKEATCTEDGSKEQVCACGEKKTETIAAKGHTWTGSDKTGDYTKQTCSCGAESVLLKYADSTRAAIPGLSDSATGATEKLKNATATWDLTSLPRAKYNIWVNCKSTKSDHGDRKWYNMATCDPVEETRERNQDTAEMPEYRYHFDQEGEIINPTNKNSREQDGISNTAFVWCNLVEAADIGGEKLSLVHDGMGYSMIFDEVRLIKTGAAVAGYKVTFECDEHCHVEIFKTQDYSKTPVRATEAVARDSSTGAIVETGEGQVSFKLVIDDGYVLDSLKGDNTDNFKNLKAADGDNSEGVYKITKVGGEVKVTIKTKSAEAPEVGFVATFVHPEGITVTTYKVAYADGVEGTVGDTCLARTKAGIASNDSTAEPQINFRVNGVPAGKVANVEATSGKYKNIKPDPDSTGDKTLFRITKITGDLTVTITIVDAPAA